MLRSKVVTMLAVASIAALGFVGQAFAQQGGGGGGRGGPRMTAEERRAAMETRMKEALGVNDDEWKALQPKVEKVQTLAREARGGMMGGGMAGRGGRGGPGGPGGAPAEAPAPANDVEKTAVALRTVLDNKESKPEDIKPVLAAYRAARDKAKTELAQAQKDLQSVLTVRQEAALVNMGLLD